MQFNTLSVVKLAVSSVIGFGTGKIITNVVKNNVRPETVIDKVTVIAAAWVISGIATTATKKYTNDMIDDVAESATELIGKFKHSAKLGRINRDESTFEKEGLDPEEYIKSPATKTWVNKRHYQEQMLARVNAGELTPEFFLDPKLFEQDAAGNWDFIKKDDDEPADN